MALTMTPDDVDAAVRTVIGESSLNPDEMKATAAVIRNRAANSGASMSDVVHAPDQFEAWSGDKLAGIDPAGKTYQHVLQTISPVLRGDELGGFTADHFYAPSAQRALGRQAPAWDNGTGVNIGKSRFFTLGGVYGVAAPKSAAEMATAPAPSDAPAEGASGEFVMRGGKLQPADQEDDASFDNVPAAPAPAGTAAPKPFNVDDWVKEYKASQQPAAQPQATPSADDIVRSVGLDPDKLKGAPKPSGPPLTPAQRAAQKDWIAEENRRDQNESFLPPAVKAWTDAHGNTFAFGLGPSVAAEGFKDRTNLHNFLANNLHIGQPLPYTGGDAFKMAQQVDQQRLDAEAKAQPFATGVGTLTGVLSSPGTKAIAGAGERLTTAALTKTAPRLAATRVGQALPRVAGVAAVGGAQAGGEGVSRGDSPGQIAGDAAEGAAWSVPFGVAGELVAPLAQTVKNPAARKVVTTGANVVAPAAVGGALGYAGGGDKGAQQGAEMGALGGLAVAAHGTMAKGAPKPSDYAMARDLISNAGAAEDGVGRPTTTAEQLEAAHPEATTAEALGVGGQDLARRSHEGVGGVQTPLQQAIAERQKPAVLKDRIDQHAEAALGEPISTAQQDFQDQQKQLNEGPVAGAYQDALVGNGYWNPQVAGVIQEPQVRANMSRAATLLGDKAFVPNPAVRPNPLAGSAFGPPSWSMRSYLETGRLSNPKAAHPDMIPTDFLLDRSKRMLDNDVDRDDFGKVKKTSANEVTAQLSNRVRAMTGDMIPGLKEARAVAGEGLSSQQAYDNGFDLFDRGKSAETALDFASRYNGLTPPEQDATRKGYLARVNKELEKTNFNPGKLAEDPYHQALQDVMWGPDKGETFRTRLRQEAALADSAKQMQVAARPGSPAGSEENAALTGAVIGGADHGPAGVIGGGVSGYGISAAKRVADVLTGKAMTPRVRQALQEILAQPANITAKQLREQHASRRSTPPQKGSLTDRARTAAPVVAGIAARKYLKQNAQAQ